MNKLDFSIIIPLYNQEKYIERCVKSALRQDFNGTYEVVVVNDGSTDGSEEILNSFNDTRLKIFKNQNGGLAYSRNFGNSKASGEYIVYLDADDELDHSCLKTFYNKNLDYDADIILAPYCAIREHRNDIKEYFPLKKFRNKKGYLNIQNTKGEILKTNFEAWGKAYKKEFILKNNIESPIIHLAEDVPLFYKALLSTDKILLVKKPVYFYRRGHKKPYKNGKYDLVQEVIKTIHASEEIVKNYKNYNCIEKIYAQNTLKICLFWYKKFKKLDNREVFYDFSTGYLKDFGLELSFRIKSFINNLIDIL